LAESSESSGSDEESDKGSPELSEEDAVSRKVVIVLAGGLIVSRACVFVSTLQLFVSTVMIPESAERTSQSTT
jgi:hypothetical protein